MTDYQEQINKLQQQVDSLRAINKTLNNEIKDALIKQDELRRSIPAIVEKEVMRQQVRLSDLITAAQTAVANCKKEVESVRKGLIDG